MRWLDIGNEREKKKFTDECRKVKRAVRLLRIAGFSEKHKRLSMGCITER